MKKEVRIAFTGGGTGGHVYPILAVAQSIKNHFLQSSNDGSEIEYSFYYFGSPGRYAADFIKLGIKIVPIVPFKVRRYFSFENFLDIFKIPIAFFQALFKMLFVMPDVLFSKGGTGSIVLLQKSVFLLEKLLILFPHKKLFLWEIQ